MTRKISITIAFLTGLGMIFIGARFLLSPEIAKALGITLVVGTIIPVVDMLIVLSKDYNGVAQAIPHISAIIVCAVIGTILLISKTSNQAS
jgi:glucose uptake protein GlcU